VTNGIKELLEKNPDCKNVQDLVKSGRIDEELLGEWAGRRCIRGVYASIALARFLPGK
jgi:hypothetical protein